MSAKKSRKILKPLILLVPPPRFELGQTRIRNPVLYPTELRGRFEEKKINMDSLIHCQPEFMGQCRLHSAGFSNERAATLAPVEWLRLPL